MKFLKGGYQNKLPEQPPLIISLLNVNVSADKRILAREVPIYETGFFKI